MRAGDNSNQTEPVYGVNYNPPVGPGLWSPDPTGTNKNAVGAYWSTVRPFVIKTASQFRLPPPPKLKSIEYEMVNRNL